MSEMSETNQMLIPPFLVEEFGMWTTRDGEKIYFKDMGTDHIKNTLEMLLRDHENHSKPGIRYWIDLFKYELRERN